MNLHRIEDHWKQFKGSVRAQWGKLADDQTEMVAGKYEYLAGKIQPTYGVSKDATQKRLTDWQKRMRAFIEAKRSSKPM